MEIDWIKTLNEVFNLAKFAAGVVPAVWYLSHRLTKIEGIISENEKSSIARDGSSINAVSLTKAEMINEIQKVDSKVDKLDIKLSGEIKEIKSNFASELNNVNEKVADVRVSVKDVRDRVYSFEDKVEGLMLVCSDKITSMTTGSKRKSHAIPQKQS